MKIAELTITNFMPYKDEQRVIFPQHETQNVMLVFGDNMRGKTSFLNAIRWCFYGVAVGRHLRAIPRLNLVNVDAAEENDWTMSAAIKFTHDSNEYELRRQITKKDHIATPKSDADFDEVIGLRINGDAQPGDTIINEVNSIVPEEISRFFLFDGELLQEYENLLINESEQGEKIKEHIEQALGVPALIHARDEFGVLLIEARRAQAKDAKKNNELKSYSEQHRQLEIRYASLQKDLVDLRVQETDLTKKIDDIDDELNNTEAVQRKKIEIEKLKSERNSYEQRISELINEERSLLKNAWIDVLHDVISPLVNKLKEQRDALQDAASNRAVLESKIKDLINSLDNPTCPTCHQSIPESNLADIRQQLSLLQAELELTEYRAEDISSINMRIDKLLQITSQNECERIVGINSRQRKLQVNLIGVETKLDELDEEIRGYDTDMIMRQREKRDRLIAQKSRVTEDIEKRKIEVDKNVKEQDHIATLISRNEQAKNQLSSIRVKIYHELESVFSASIDALRDSLRADVESYASNAFSELTTEKTYKGLRINNNYGLSIIDHEGRVLKERSAGAEQIVALSLIDGLNKTARKSAPIIMDTPLGRLDPTHRSNVLKYLPQMAEQVVLLVHEGEIDPSNDIHNFADRIGVRYRIERISSTESRIEKVV
ncbi:MAG: AAA family ATPase [Gammaproteobacteria bacterium]|nr:AAA family ATPase [Gammaproteobacteria bacterium]MCW8839751.1 AAA family ATPase [Gammaproteobacteria bacterium]MCW8959273.1 AAA family ATPase [Gammaproteobacteria bacterium]MCW8992436.1 AAA family ATPase [Gammaproteobacteria bacterium]